MHRPGNRSDTTAKFKFRVSFRLTGGSPDLGEPLFNVVWSGDWAPGTTPTDATIAPADVLGSGLSAWPSVTRAGTEFHLAQAAERGGMLRIFDVVGRRVRELQVPAGASRISWNGRDGAGVVTPGGVYFARYENGQETLVTRVVRLR